MAAASAAIVTVGTELVTGLVLDTNTADIGIALTAAGVAVRERVSVPDEVETVARQLERLVAELRSPTDETLLAIEFLATARRIDELEEVVLADETHRVVADALRRLRYEERLAIFTRYFLDLSEAEAAVVLGCPAGTVKSRLSRGLEQLRADLQREPDA